MKGNQDNPLPFREYRQASMHQSQANATHVNAEGACHNTVPDLNLSPLLLTEAELIQLLRIPEISSANDYHNVIENLKRIHNSPCIHICKKPLFPLEAIRQWILDKAEMEQHGI